MNTSGVAKIHWTTNTSRPGEGTSGNDPGDEPHLLTNRAALCDRQHFGVSFASDLFPEFVREVAEAVISFSAATRRTPCGAGKLLLISDEHFCLTVNFVMLRESAISLNENRVLITTSTGGPHYLGCYVTAGRRVNMNRIGHPLVLAPKRGTA